MPAAHEQPVAPTIEHGDRVAAARDIDTTQGIHIVEGSVGTVAEDRGSNLVVAFDGKPGVSNLRDADLRTVS